MNKTLLMQRAQGFYDGNKNFDGLGSIQIKKIVITTVTKKGIPEASKRNNCSTDAARKSRSEDPTDLERRKKNDPVL